MYDKIWNSLSEAYDAFSKGIADWDTVIAFKKTMDFYLVELVYAPMKEQEKKKIKSEFDEAVKGISRDTKEGLQEIAKQMDNTIKGKLGTAITTTLHDKSQKWDAL